MPFHFRQNHFRCFFTESRRIQTGNHRLLQKIANRLPRDVFLQHGVQQLVALFHEKSVDFRMMLVN